MSLDAVVRMARGALDLDVALAAPDGGVVAVLGPNGAGKTSVLHGLAGLARLGAGHVGVGGATWADERRHLDPDEAARNDDEQRQG